MKPISKLSPIGNFCVSLGVIPSSYMESLSYEEQLMWFCQYLEKEVLPAVNTNAEAIEELQKYLQIHGQEEVRKYIDELVADGTMDRLLNTNLTGRLSDLQTTNKTNLVSAINEVNKKVVKLYSSSINTSGVFTLNDNINNYDEILIKASLNNYYHYMHYNRYQLIDSDLKSYTWQLLAWFQYEEDESNFILESEKFKLYDNIIDTTGLTGRIGSEDNKVKIYGIYGIKY